MELKYNTLKAAITTLIGETALTTQASAQAFTLNTGDVLSIDAGIQTETTSGNFNAITIGSYFGMDISGNSNISGTEQFPISGVGAPGIVIGQTNTAGVYHPGAPTAGDVGPVDNAWHFNNSTGTHWFNGIAPTGDTTNGINFGGWTMAWNTSGNIPLNSGAWTPGNCATSLGCSAGATFTDGMAFFSWDGVYGNAYQIDYTATFQNTGFSGTQYFLRLTGIVSAAPVPVPAAVWLFGSGLLGLIGVARRKSSS